MSLQGAGINQEELTKHLHRRLCRHLQAQVALCTCTHKAWMAMHPTPLEMGSGG